MAGLDALGVEAEFLWIDGDTIDELGLDSTGRDWHPRFPYTWVKLTEEERARVPDDVLIPALFGIDPKDSTEVFAGYHRPRHRWNGFACPEFDRAQVERIITWSHKLADDGGPDAAARFAWDGEVLVQTERCGDEAEVQRISPNNLKRYAVGAFAWTWSEVEPPEDADLDAWLTEQAEETRKYVEAARAGAAEYLRLLVAGDDIYVFEAGDGRIDMQEMVCIGANLDTERFKVPAAKWDEVRAKLGADGSDVQIIDCRRS